MSDINWAAIAECACPGCAAAILAIRSALALNGNLHIPGSNTRQGMSALYSLTIATCCPSSAAASGREKR